LPFKGRSFGGEKPINKEANKEVLRRIGRRR